MREKLKYFVLNKAYDFRRGICDGMNPDGDRLCISGGSSRCGRFISRIFNSGEIGMLWHRLVVDAQGSTAEDMRITVYASDSDKAESDGKEMLLSDILHSEKIGFDRKLEAFKPYIKKVTAKSTDILLHEVQGQYMWFLLEVYQRGSESGYVNKVTAFLPSVSWIDYLPQIYRKSDTYSHFLERYLAIFQTMYEDLNGSIDNITDYFDPLSAQGEFLSWIADWLYISESYLWPEEKLRTLLLNAMDIYRSRGTKESLSRIVELYTGQKPYIVEEFELRHYMGTKEYEETLLPMYGNDPYRVLVFASKEIIRSERDHNILVKIMDDVKPVNIEIKLILLEPYIFLDKYSYLGLNSALGQYMPAILDGSAQITLSTLNNNSQEEI